MSTFNRQTKHPVTGEWENATWYDDWFGNHRYGVVFPSDLKKGYTARDCAYNPEDTKLETKE